MSQEQLLDAFAQDVGKDIFAAGQWHNALFTRRKLHSGVLLGPLGGSVVNFSQRAPPFSFVYPQLLAIAPSVPEDT
jgi:hypothetical protein